MAHKSELISRVARLLNGDFRSEDLTRLFLFLRERNNGIWSVKEIGDFIAHSDERVKGPTTNEVRAFFTHIRLLVPYIRAGKKVDLSDLPSEFPAALKGNFRRIDSAIIKRDTGLKRKLAAATLSSALAKLGSRADGRLSLKTALDADELAILKCSLAAINANALFTDADLYRDFCLVLEKNDLLTAEDRPKMKAVEPGIILFAIAQMHLAEIIYNVDLKAELFATNHNGKLDVWAGGECPLNNAETINLNVPFFSTNLNTNDWSNPDLFDDGPRCRKPIEVTNEPKLVVL